ncbi:MAG: 16S rRNA (uracil(1498)-N(3))-methyltransferase, partial [Raineya sp.]
LMSALFYCPEIAENPVLSEEESRHCLQVLRYQIGDKIKLIDGKGYFWEAEITEKQAKKCLLKIIDKHLDERNQRNYHFHLAIAPTKNIERIEWLVEKCTEIGIDEISFLLCQRSERKELKLERLEKIAVQAAKQSQRAFLPKINEMQKLSVFLEKTKLHKAQKWIAHLEENERKIFGKNLIVPQNNYCVLIGPEGDFGTEEIVLAKSFGFEAISLGNSVLRTETAGVYVCAGLAVFNT